MNGVVRCPRRSRPLPIAPPVIGLRQCRRHLRTADASHRSRIVSSLANAPGQGRGKRRDSECVYRHDNVPSRPRLQNERFCTQTESVTQGLRSASFEPKPSHHIADAFGDAGARMCEPEGTSRSRRRHSRLDGELRALSGLETECVVTQDVVSGVACPGLIVADRRGEIVYVAAPSAAADLPQPSELIEWIRYVQHQCPECQGEAK